MIDIVLLIGRILFVAFLYVFLFTVMRTGIGLVKGQRKDAAIWCVDVEKGPRNLRGLHVDILGPIVIGRSPNSDIVIDQPIVSASHTRLTLQGPALVLEDLHSTNGTLINGQMVSDPITLCDADEIQIGDAVLRVNRR